MLLISDPLRRVHFKELVKDSNRLNEDKVSE